MDVAVSGIPSVGQSNQCSRYTEGLKLTLFLTEFYCDHVRKHPKRPLLSKENFLLLSEISGSVAANRPSGHRLAPNFSVPVFSWSVHRATHIC